MATPIAEFTSQKIKFWSFVSMILLVFVHGYNLQQRYLQPWTIVDEPLTLNSFTQYFLANGIFRFRIPMLFIISGYLFAVNDHKPYPKTIQKRLKTLMLPYILWSAIGLGFTFLLENFDFTKNIVANTHLMQIDEHRLLLHSYKWYEVMGRWLLVPVPFQLWFIRVLFIYNLMYPWLRWCVLHPIAQKIFFAFAVFLWLTTMGLFFIEGEGLFFFSLGIWIQKSNYNIEKSHKWQNPLVWGIIFFATSFVKSWLAFKGLHLLGNGVFSLLTLLHKITIFSGLIFAWFASNRLVSYCMTNNLFKKASNFSFIIYALHVPLITFAIDAIFPFVQTINHYRLVIFVVLPLVVIGFCILFGWILKQLSPKTYAIFTGNRGI